MQESAKVRFAASLKRSYFIRFHMATILVATILCGLLLSKVLLLLGVGAMAVRYPASVTLSYLCFFLFVRLWLMYVSRAPSGPSGNTLLDIVDFGPSPGGSGSGLPEKVAFGGGRFGGSGAGGTFETAGEGIGASQEAGAGVAVDGAAGSATETVGDAASSIFDSEEAAILLILFGLLMAAVFGAAVYLVCSGPDILTEAAFQAFLASGLLRRARGMDSPGWTGSVFRATWPSFAIVLALSFLFAVVARSYHPEARTVVELYRLLRAGN